MSIVKAEPAKAITGPIMYVIVGKVRKRDQVFRPVAFRSDFTMLPSSIAAGEETARVAEEMFAPYDKRRSRKGILLTHSFSPDEFDRNDPEHQQRVLELAYELAKRVAPNAPCVVGVHADRNHLHAHVFILNHDTQTMRALRKGFVYGDVKDLNDELMEENVLLVAEPGEVSKTKESVWLRRRGVEIPDHAGMTHLDVTEANWQPWVRDTVDSVLDDAGRVRRFESRGGKTYTMSRPGTVFGTDYTYQAIEQSIADRQKEIQHEQQGRATEEVAGASIEDVGGELRSDASDAAETRADAGGGDVNRSSDPAGGDAGIRRFAGGDGFDHEGDRQTPGRRKAPVVAGRGNGEDPGVQAGASGTVAQLDRLNDSIERKAKRHRTKTDDWIDTVAERVEARLDRGVGVAARRILQPQSLMEVLAWLLVLYMEQRQQTAELREWTADKHATMTAPVERPLSGPLAALSDDAIRFLSTHEDGATAGYEQFAEERYEAYAGRKRAAGEVPRPMADYYDVSWGNAVQAARGEATVGGSLPVPARAFLLETNRFDRFIAWRASTDHRAWSQPLKTEDIAGMTPPVAAAAQRCPEFVRYIATHGQLDAYAQRAKRLRDIRHTDDAFYARTVDEASDQRVRDQRQVAGANATLPTPKEGLVD